MAQYTGDGLNDHAVLEYDSSESVAEIMESDLWDELCGTDQVTDECCLHMEGVDWLMRMVRKCLAMEGCYFAALEK